MKLLIKWLGLPRAEKRLAVEMAPLLVLIDLGLKLLHFPTLRRALAWAARAGRGAAAESGCAARGDAVYQRRVAWAASAVGRRLLGSGSCLAQALAVQLLYRRANIPAELCIGVARGSGPGPAAQPLAGARAGGSRLVAHAWVEVDRAVAAGGTAEELKAYTRLPALDRSQP
jgi:hypothetical protein